MFKGLIHDFSVEYGQKILVWLIWKDLFQVFILVKST
jgi:hypothetical protein